MKEVFIVFVILLVLLLILSTLGGSIRIRESFDDDIPLYEETLLPPHAKPWAFNPNYVKEEEERPEFKKMSKPKQNKQVIQEESVTSVPEPLSPYFENDDNYDGVSPFENDVDFAAV